MGGAMPSVPAEAGDEDELHGKNEEKAQDMTESEQGRSGEDSQEQQNEGDDTGEEEEDPGECGFCLFMKSGPCRDSFIAWEQCIEQAEKNEEDMVEKCHKVTFMLKECMEHNSDYYEPVLQAEKVLGEAALEEEAAAASQGGADASPPDLQVHLQSEDKPSLDAPQSQVPTHVHSEEHHIHTDEEHTHASSEEHHVRSSLDIPAGAPNPPDSRVAAQERSSGSSA